MSWLKLDDAMVGHRKTRRLLRSQRAGLGLASFGLHGLALLHCSQYLTDGFVETEFVEETLDDATVRGKNRDAIVDGLLRGGQWSRVDGGFQVHDYLDHNPSRALVLEQRAKDAARKKAGRNGQSNGSPEGVQPDSPRTSPEIQAESDGPVPSRPVRGEEEGRASATHPNLTEVIAVYSALPADHAVEVDEYQLNSICMSVRDADQVSVANLAVSWQVSPEMGHWRTASSLQFSALKSLAKRDAQLAGIRDAATAAGIAPPILSPRDQAKADKAARSEQDLAAVARLMNQGEAA